MLDWLARARPWINALLVLLLLLPIARLAWRFIVPPEPALSAARPAETAPPPARRTMDVASLRQAMLFGQSSGPGTNGEMPESTLPLKLQGVIAAGSSSYATAVFDSGEPKSRAARVGMALQPGVVLKAVYKDKVIISNNGRDEKISLQRPPEIAINGAPPPGSQPMYPPGIEPATPPEGYVPQPINSGPPPGYNPSMQQNMPPGGQPNMPPTMQPQYNAPSPNQPGGYSSYSGQPNTATQEFQPHPYRR